MPLPPGQPARRRAVGAGPLLSVPVFCLAMVRHSRQHSTRDGDEVEHRGDRQHSRREPAAAPNSPPEQQPMQMIVVAAPVPPPLPAPGQPARDGKVEGSRRVGAPFEITNKSRYALTRVTMPGPSTVTASSCAAKSSTPHAAPPSNTMPGPGPVESGGCRFPPQASRQETAR